MYYRWKPIRIQDAYQVFYHYNKAHVITVPGKPAGWRAREELMLQFKSEDRQMENSFLRRGGIPVFCATQAFNWWWSPPILPLSNLHSSDPTNLIVSFIQKHPHRNTRIMFDHVSEHCGPANLTHRINHHTSWLTDVNNFAPGSRSVSGKSWAKFLSRYSHQCHPMPCPLLQILPFLFLSIDLDTHCNILDQYSSL